MYKEDAPSARKNGAAPRSKVKINRELYILRANFTFLINKGFIMDIQDV